MKIWKLTVAYVAAFVLQLSVMGMFSAGGVSPSLLLTLTMILIYLFDNEAGCIGCCIVSGLLLDMAAGEYMGVYGLTFFLVGMFTLFYKQIFNYESRLSVIPLTAAGSLIYTAVPFAVTAIAGYSVSAVRFVTFTLILICMNLVVMYIFYFLMIRRASYRPKRSRYERYETI